MENKKDNSPNPSQADNSRNQVVLRLFEKDNFFLFIYKKTERIVSALYLTSSLFSDNEPIKWQVREVGVSVIARVLSLTANPHSKQEIVSGINADLLRLLSLLDIAFGAGFVSEMNFSILKKELENILETIIFHVSPKEIRGSAGVLFDKEFFALPRNIFFSDNGEGGVGHLPVSLDTGVNHQQETALYSWSDVSKLEDIYKRQNKGHEKDNQSLTPILVTGAKAHTYNKGQSINGGAAAGGRELTIIKLLKDKNNLTIRDFFLVIKGCSEKTIQRELLRLVKLGVLKKSGERRWSRYSLATA